MLEKIISVATADNDFRKKLLETKKAADPAEALCQLCSKYEFELSIGELFAYGEEYGDNLRKSVNGGATDPIEGWDDSFDLFFAALEGMKKYD